MTIDHDHHTLRNRSTGLGFALGLMALGGCTAQSDDEPFGDEGTARLSPGATLFYDGTEGQADALDPSVCTTHGYRDSDQRVFAGDVSQRFELRPSDGKCKNKYRSELQLNDIEVGVDYWYGFAMYIPSSVPADEGFLFWQIHGRKDDCEGYRNPPAGLALSDGELRVTHTWDSRRCSTGSNVRDNKTQRVVADIARDQWHEYVIHLRMNPSGGGRYEIWQDGDKVYDYAGRVGFNDARDPYVKWGMYSYNSPVDRRSVVYMDEMRIVEDGTFDDVDPGGSVELVNLALGSDASGPGNTQAANPASHLVDGDESTRWSAQGFPKAVQIDLGSVSAIRRARLVPHQGRAYRYEIQARRRPSDGWTRIVDRRNNDTPASEFIDDFAPMDARYVRLRVVGVDGGVTSWSSVRELEILGE